MVRESDVRRGCATTTDMCKEKGGRKTAHGRYTRRGVAGVTGRVPPGPGANMKRSVRK